MYQPKLLRAGRVLDHDEAVRLVAKGCAVTVAVPDEDLMGMGDLRVTVTAGTTAGGDPCAYASLPAAGQLCAGDLEVYAAVMAAAASLCDGANKVMLARELAGA
jgi:hypothetical protein